MARTPVLDPEEYIEQAYFFGVFRERLAENQAAQDVLERLHEEILATTRLPLAIQFLATDIKHTGLLASGFRRLSHYFTPFQAYIVSRAEEPGARFSMDLALRCLEAEATYRSKQPSPAGLFVFEFEVMCRNKLGYDEGLTAMGEDAAFGAEWVGYLETVRRNVGEVDFADLIYVRSELGNQEALKREPESKLPPALFGAKEGKIAKASHGRDPLYLFSALQRQLGYPEVPRLTQRDDPRAALAAIQAKLVELDQKVRLLDGEVRGAVDQIQALGKPETLTIKPIELA
jgi:hypothetical protein